MPLFGQLAGAVVSRGQSGANPAVGAPLNPPTILSFAFSDMAIDEDVAGTFTATITGTLTNWSLDPGDGSAPYTGSGSSISQAHTYADAGTYDAILTATGPGGSDFETILDITVNVVGGATFQAVTTLKSDTSGEQWAFFGLPGGTPGTIATGRKSKIVAEYPQASGTYYPVQVDNHLSKEADGSLIHAACSVKLPAGYTAGAKVNIGYSDTYSFPAAPNWTTVKASSVPDFSTTISVFAPKIVLFFIANTPHVGDVIEITLGGTTYTQEINSFDLVEMNGYFQNLCHAISRRITQAAGGLFQAYENTSAYVLPFDVDHNDARNPNSNFAQFGLNSWSAKVTQNVFTDRGMQMSTGLGYSASYTPISWVTGSGTANSSPANLYYSNSFPIWTKPASGDPVDFTATFSITKQGRFVNLSSGLSSFGRGNKILNYDGGTQAFTVGQRVRGATSGAEGEIVAISGTTSSGKLLLKYCTATDFIDNEALSGRIFSYGWVAAGSTAGSGAALANGTLQDNVLTGGTSGATARIVDRDPYSRAAYALAVVPISGTFTGGETVTDSMTGSGTFVSLGSVSNAELQTGASTRAASGSLPVIQAAAARTTYTADFNDGTASSFGPWLDGHQAREEENICEFVDGSSNAHPHLRARKTVRWDRDGNRIDHQLVVESPDMFNWNQDYWYDVTAITVDGVNQIPSDDADVIDLDDYKQLMHTPWAKWSWAQPQPFSMCDPLHFFDAWLMPRYRQFTRDVTTGFYCAIKGTDSTGDRIFNASPLTNARTGQFAKPKIRWPLYASNLKMDAAGGASPSIGVHSGWEWAFWSNNDKAGLWPLMEAFASNSMDAFPFYPRDAAGPDADWQDFTPHPYLRWQYGMTHSRGETSTGKGTTLANRYKLAIRSDDQLHKDTAAVTGAGGSDSMPKEMSMWKGSVYGAYASGRVMAYSHAPPHPGRTCYLVRPEKRFHDSFLQYSWAMGTALPGSHVNNTCLSPHKTGGAAGDVDHVLGYSTSNGARYLAWNARSWMMAAATTFDRHFARDTLRRAANDLKNHVEEIVTNSWNGFVRVAGSRNSDNWTTFPSQQAGERWRQESDGNTVSFGGVAPNIDFFKGGYLLAVTMNAHLLDVFDASTIANTSGAGYAKIVDDLDPADWWRFMSQSGMFIGETDSNTGNSTSQLIYASTDMAAVQADQDPKSIAWKQQLNMCATGPYITSPQKDFQTASETGGYGISCINSPNYSIYAYRRDLFSLFSVCASNSAVVSATDAIVTLLDTYLPPDTVDTNGRQGGGDIGDRYDYNWGVMSRVRPAEMTTPW